MSTGRFSPLRAPSGDPISSDPPSGDPISRTASRIASCNLRENDQLIETNDCLLLYGPTNAAEITRLTSTNALANEATDGDGGDPDAVDSEPWIRVAKNDENLTTATIKNINEELPMLLGAPLEKRELFIEAVNKRDKSGVIAVFKDIVAGEWQPEDPIGLLQSSFIFVSQGSVCCNSEISRYRAKPKTFSMMK